MKKLISMAVAIMMLVSTTVTANAATKTRVLVEGNEGRFWQTYLYGEYTSGGESCGHTGIDFISKNSSGAVAPMDVYAAEDGSVADAGRNNLAGNFINIDHGGYYTCYQHLSSISVKEGDTVTAGQKIGVTGKTGVANGIHLHFGVKVNGTNTINARNPEKYLASLNNTGRLAGKFNYSIAYPSAASNATQVRNFTKPSSVSYTGNKFVYGSIYPKTSTQFLDNEDFFIGDITLGRYTMAISGLGQTMTQSVLITSGYNSVYLNAGTQTESVAYSMENGEFDCFAGDNVAIDMNDLLALPVMDARTSPTEEETVYCDNSGNAGKLISSIDNQILFTAEAGKKVFEPIWSPDGSKVAFLESEEMINDCMKSIAYVYDVQTGSIVSTGIEIDYFRGNSKVFEWAKDSERLLVCSRPIAIYDCSVGEFTIISGTSAPAEEMFNSDESEKTTSASFSPSNDKIAFVSLDDGLCLKTYDLATGQVKLVSKMPGTEYGTLIMAEPAWYSDNVVYHMGIDPMTKRQGIYKTNLENDSTEKVISDACEMKISPNRDYIAYRDFSGTLRNCVYQIETGLITPVEGSYGMCDVVWNSPTEFALVRDGQVMSANVEGKILDEHSIDVMSGNYLAAASIDELKRERAQCKVE